jgi:hypothetical protein
VIETTLNRNLFYGNHFLLVFFFKKCISSFFFFYSHVGSLVASPAKPVARPFRHLLDSMVNNILIAIGDFPKISWAHSKRYLLIQHEESLHFTIPISKHLVQNNCGLRKLAFSAPPFLQICGTISPSKLVTSSVCLNIYSTLLAKVRSHTKLCPPHCPTRNNCITTFG